MCIRISANGSKKSLAASPIIVFNGKLAVDNVSRADVEQFKCKLQAEPFTDDGWSVTRAQARAVVSSLAPFGHKLSGSK